RAASRGARWLRRADTLVRRDCDILDDQGSHAFDLAGRSLLSGTESRQTADRSVHPTLSHPKPTEKASSRLAPRDAAAAPNKLSDTNPSCSSAYAPGRG